MVASLKRRTRDKPAEAKCRQSSVNKMVPLESDQIRHVDGGASLAARNDVREVEPTKLELPNLKFTFSAADGEPWT